MPDSFWRHLPDAAVLFGGWGAGWVLTRLLPGRLRQVPGLILAWVNAAVSAAGLLAVLFAMADSRLGFEWMLLRGCAFAWACCLMASTAIAALWHHLERRPFSPHRRRLLRAAGCTAMTAPAAVTTFGIVAGREQFRLVEVDLRVPGLPPDLHGVRLAQLSDIHLSPYLSRAELRRCVDMANAAKPNLALVTGDLVTGSKDPLNDCLEELARLRSDAGTYGCLGNHEVYIQAERYVIDEGRRRGLRFLRRENARLRFGQATLNLAGVEYQRMRKPYLAGAERLLDPDAFNLLLSHNPDVFPVAARQGWSVTLAGHTHGGQVNVEILEQNLNLVRAFITPYVYGAYHRGPASMFVTRGIGTVGVPARIGAPPEVALIRLCAI